MNQHIGWQQDPQDPTVSRYWDGTTWSGELRWNGTEWADATAAATEPQGATHVEPPADAGVAPAPVASGPGGITSGFPMTRTSWVLGVGAALAGVGIVLPWAEARSSYSSASVSASDIGAAAFLLVAIVAGVVWLAWPSRIQRLSPARLIGVAALAVVMSIVVIGNFGSLGEVQAESEADAASSEQAYVDNYGQYAGDFVNDMYADSMEATKVEYSAGFGLLLWTTGTVVVWAGVAIALLERSKTPDPAPSALTLV